MDSTLTSTAEPMMSEPKSRGVVVEGSSTSSSSTVAAQQQPQPQPPSRYGSQKRRDWNTFQHYLKSHKPPLTLARCSGAHVIEFLKYLDQFGKTEVHISGCPSFGHPNPPSPCSCPLNQAWGSLDALIGRLRAAYEENGGKPDSNPFAARPVRIYLRGVRQGQAKARGIPYEKKKRNHQNTSLSSTTTTSSSDHVIVAHHQLVVHDTAGSGGANSDSSSSHHVAAIVVSTTTVTTVDVDPTPTTTTTTTVA